MYYVFFSVPFIGMGTSHYTPDVLFFDMGTSHYTPDVLFFDMFDLKSSLLPH
jgi:hypothetical protein